MSTLKDLKFISFMTTVSSSAIYYQLFVLAPEQGTIHSHTYNVSIQTLFDWVIIKVSEMKVEYILGWG